MIENLIKTLCTMLVNVFSSIAYDTGKKVIEVHKEKQFQEDLHKWLEKFFSAHEELVFEARAFYNFMIYQDPCRKIVQYLLGFYPLAISEEEFLNRLVSDCVNSIMQARGKCSIYEERNVYELFQGVFHLCKDMLQKETTAGEKLILHELKQQDAKVETLCQGIASQIGGIYEQLQNLPPQQKTSYPRLLTDRAPKAPTEFVARQETINNILERLGENKNLVIVNGMGGVGKSAICKWLFHYFEANSNIPLAWVEYDRKSLFNCFIKQFHYPGADIKERENLLSSFLQQDIEENGIIFIDNLDVTERDEPYIQTLTNTKCRVVCSSRITGFDFFETVRVDLLSPEYAQLLFLSYYDPGASYEQYSSLEQNCIKSIVEKLAYHTLTIEVIAKIGRVEKQTLESIQVNLDRVGLNFSGIAKVNFTEKTLIGHLCRIFSIRKLGLKHRQILGAIALYPLNQVPKEVLYWLNVQNNTTIRFLIRHAWFTEDNDSFYMHPIIKEVVRRLCPLKYEDSGALINAILKKTEYQNKIPILKIMEWIPYAEQVVKRFRYNYTLEIASLEYNIATAYSVTGNYTQGLRYITPAITTLEKLSITTDQLALAYNQKGYIYYSRQNYSDKRAYTFYQKALLLPNVKGRTRAETYESLALCLHGMYENGVKKGDDKQVLNSILRQAEGCHFQANKFFLESGNELHLASSYNNTGDYYRLIGNAYLAIRYYNRARKIREKEQVATSLDLSTTYFRLGEIYLEVSDKQSLPGWKRGRRVKRAQDYYKRCYQIRVEQIAKGNTSRNVNNVIQRINQCEAILSGLG